ncbi:hypothetical protein JZO70_12820 [Enterococcus sp. 669A]|uniref:Uncharacterized protein n=1 Tax=Candidatus Enterococcus moelleringii TaxID=2815325 RepID=A0ABS3LBP0_9ENTE|nr:hypothetical protein [Enterococcus sp. 669A]MBO1307052.1 hypothetical protein [Enterococcus sp. 669A]
MLKKDVNTIHLITNNHTLTYTNSFYYNWYKTLQGNLLQTNGFTNQFVRLQKNAPETYKKIEQRLLATSIVAFLKQLDATDSFLLLTTSWSTGLASDHPAKTLENYLTHYTIQADDLRGLNQMNADFNQVLIQHFPIARKQDLRLIYRLLELYPLEKIDQDNELTKLNERAAARTTNLLSLLQDAFALAAESKQALNDPELAEYFN